VNSAFFSIKWIVEALAKIDNSAWISIVPVLIVLGFRLDLIEGLMAITNKPTFERVRMRGLMPILNFLSIPSLLHLFIVPIVEQLSPTVFCFRNGPIGNNLDSAQRLSNKVKKDGSVSVRW
jgi:hypothetical protein